MPSKTVIIGCLLVLVLMLYTLSGFAQSTQIPQRLENPAILLQDRLPITSEAARDMRLLAMWELGRLSDVDWIDNDHLAILSDGGTWLYNLDDPQHPVANIPDAALRYTGYGQDRLIVSPDGQWLSLTPGSLDREPLSFDVWHIPTGKHVDLKIEETARDILDTAFGIDVHSAFVAWLPDGQLITIVNADMILWDFSQGEAVVEAIISIPRTRRTAYHIEQFGISSDSSSIVVALRADISDQLIVQLWKLDTGEHRTLYEDVLLPETPLETRGIQFNGDGSEIALVLSYHVEPPGEHSYARGEVWRWDAASGEALAPYVLDCDMRQFNYQFDYGLCPSKEYNTSGYALLEMHRLSDGRLLTDPFPVPFSVAFNSTRKLGHYLVFTGQIMQPQTASANPNYITVRDPGGEEITSFELGVQLINGVAISPDESRLAIAFEDRVQVVHIDDPEHQSMIENNGLVHGLSVDISPDGRYLVAVGNISYRTGRVSDRQVGRVVRWSLETSEYEVIPNQEQATVAAYSPDGSLLVIGQEDGNLYVYDAETLTERGKLFDDPGITDLAFSHDGRLLATASNCYVQLWDIQNQQIINRVEHSDIGSLVFTAEDDWLLYGRTVWKIEDQGWLVARWDVEDASDEVRALVFYTFPVDYEAENALLLRAQYDVSLVDMRNLTEPQLVGSIPLLWRADDPPPAIALSEDLVAVLHENGVISLYGIPQEN